LRNNFDGAFETLDHLRKESKLQSLTEKEKSELKIFYILKKSQSYESNFASTLTPQYFNTSIKLWVLWFVVSYIFYGVLFLIPEVIGKNKENINFNDLIIAVIFSTFYEVIGILSTLMIEMPSIGRIGAFKISFILCSILALICTLQGQNWMAALHCLKGAVQISTRALYIYTSECYPTEIRGIALGLANVSTRLAGLLVPIINEILLGFSNNFAFFGIFTASLIGTLFSFMIKVETLNVKLD
jgi:putative MFS transporter